MHKKGLLNRMKTLSVSSCELHKILWQKMCVSKVLTRSLDERTKHNGHIGPMCAEPFTDDCVHIVPKSQILPKPCQKTNTDSCTSSKINLSRNNAVPTCWALFVRLHNALKKIAFSVFVSHC